MHPKDFREILLDRLLTFLWRQWSALEMSRYEPRLSTAGLPSDLQQKTALKLLNNIFGLEYGEPSHHA
jgi:hypothetical protein